MSIYDAFVPVSLSVYEDPTVKPRQGIQKKEGKRRPKVFWAKSGFRGVTCNRPTQQKPWMAYIIADGKMRNLGYYKKKEEAARVYNICAQRMFGEEAVLNPV